MTERKGGPGNQPFPFDDDVSEADYVELDAQDIRMPGTNTEDVAGLDRGSASPTGDPGGGPQPARQVSARRKRRGMLRRKKKGLMPSGAAAGGTGASEPGGAGEYDVAAGGSSGGARGIAAAGGPRRRGPGARRRAGVRSRAGAAGPDDGRAADYDAAVTNGRQILMQMMQRFSPESEAADDDSRRRGLSQALRGIARGYRELEREVERLNRLLDGSR